MLKLSLLFLEPFCVFRELQKWIIKRNFQVPSVTTIDVACICRIMVFQSEISPAWIVLSITTAQSTTIIELEILNQAETKFCVFVANIVVVYSII